RVADCPAGKAPDHPARRFLIDPEGTLSEVLQRYGRIAQETLFENFCALDLGPAVHAQEGATLTTGPVGEEIVAAAEQDAIGLHLHLGAPVTPAVVIEQPHQTTALDRFAESFHHNGIALWTGAGPNGDPFSLQYRLHVGLQPATDGRRQERRHLFR